MYTYIGQWKQAEFFLLIFVKCLILSFFLVLMVIGIYVKTQERGSRKGWERMRILTSSSFFRTMLVYFLGVTVVLLLLCILFPSFLASLPLWNRTLLVLLWFSLFLTYSFIQPANIFWMCGFIPNVWWIFCCKRSLLVKG